MTALHMIGIPVFRPAAGRLDVVRDRREHTSQSPAPVRPRAQLVNRFPSSRRLVTAAVRAGRRIVPMHGLLEVDVTEAWRRLTATTPPLSLTAFVIASVGRAAAQHPEVLPTETGAGAWCSTRMWTCRRW
jgi:hypothetical protein